ncbi:MFS transporter [Actinomycetaceae bacterium MB13-C1-2]|nr:MFS transporter [Actinomycetaceae bacterium MB13-C1-2]
MSVEESALVPGGETPLSVGSSQTVGKSKIASWALWDWGSAAFNAVATTFVFTIFLTGDGNFTSSYQANQYLSWGLAAAGVVIALLAPITGQRADRSGKGARVLGWFSLLVFICLGLMFFVYPQSPLGPIGALWLGIGLLGVGNIFFEFASVNYNAMLNDISNSENRGKISGIGWGAGYLGGIVLLLILYFGFINPEVGLFGITSANGMDVRVSMVIAALWFGIFSLPVILNPPKKKTIKQAGPRETLLDSYKHLFATIKLLWNESRNTLKFLVASAIFRDGLAGVFTFGGVIAASVFGFSPGEVIIFAIAANVVAGLATIAFGPLDDKWGSRTIIMISLVLMVFLGLGVFFFQQYGPKIFWIFGLGLTVFVGPVQSASRTFLANLAPEGREGEVFGLYATTGRAVSFLSPLMYGLAITLGGAIIGGTPTYWGILGIVLILVLGLLLMIPVKSQNEQIRLHDHPTS